jgi:hypothetical protein
MLSLRYTTDKLSFKHFLNADERRLRTVFHEAGHDFIARSRNATVTEVEINSSGESWVNVADVGGLANSCDIAVAGLLAEARGVALSPIGTLKSRLNTERMADLADAILQSLHAPPADGRFRVLVPFLPGGRSAEEAEASVADFAYATEQKMQRADLVSSLTRVANDLNDDGNWHNVEKTSERFRTIDKGSNRPWTK